MNPEISPSSHAGDWLLGLRASRIWKRVGLALILGALYLIPRLIEINSLVTTDETLWLGRSANFYNAVVHTDLADTYQMVHPGVMTMWAGTVGYLVAVPNYPFDHPDQITNRAMIHVQLRDLGEDPLAVLITLRIAKLCFQMMFFLAAIWFTRLLFGRSVAIGTAVMMSLEPFLIAHDRLLHIDGLFAIASFAAIMSMAWATQSSQRLRDWMIVGVLCAMAWLNRSPGIVLIAIAAIAIILSHLGHGRRWRDWWRSALRLGIAWATGAFVTTVLLFPALLVCPVSVLGKMLSWSEDAASEGHEIPILFMGKIVQGNPGILFYPATLAFRLSPWTAAGLVLATICGLWHLRSHPRFSPNWRPLLVIFLFGFTYGLGMDLGAKKFDRYLLPDYPILDLVAAVGWITLARILWHHRIRFGRAIGIALLLLPLGGQVASAAGSYPYGLDYFSPLTGGIQGADGNIIIGWGEGLNLAAEWILAQPDGTHAKVITSANRTTLLYFLPASVDVLPPRRVGTEDALNTWLEADYYISYIQQWDRELQWREVGYVSKFDPVHTVLVDGIPFARIYDLRTTPIPPAILAGADCPWNFTNRVILVNSYREPLRLPRILSTTRTLNFTFVTGPRPLPATPVQFQAKLEPLTGTGKTIISNISYQTPSQPGTRFVITTTLSLASETTLSDYQMTIAVIDPSTGQAIQTRAEGQIRGSLVATPNTCKPYIPVSLEP